MLKAEYAQQLWSVLAKYEHNLSDVSAHTITTIQLTTHAIVLPLSTNIYLQQAMKQNIPRHKAIMTMMTTALGLFSKAAQ